MLLVAKWALLLACEVILPRTNLLEPSTSLASEAKTSQNDGPARGASIQSPQANQESTAQTGITNSGCGYFKLRELRFPVTYMSRKNTRSVILFVSRDQKVWFQAAIVSPDEDFVKYHAKEDGTYFFKLVHEDHEGVRTPKLDAGSQPDQTVIVDTVAPKIRFNTVKREWNKITLEWVVDDANPDPDATQLEFRVMGAAENAWRGVMLPADSKTGLPLDGVQFFVGVADKIQIRLTAVDCAGNKAESVYELNAAVASPLPTYYVPVCSAVAVSPNQLSLVNDLESELAKVELELIAKELKLLAAEKSLTPDTEEKIDRLRSRLHDAHERLRNEAASTSQISPKPSGSETQSDLAMPVPPGPQTFSPNALPIPYTDGSKEFRQFYEQTVPSLRGYPFPTEPPIPPAGDGPAIVIPRHGEIPRPETLNAHSPPPPLPTIPEAYPSQLPAAPSPHRKID